MEPLPDLLVGSIVCQYREMGFRRRVRFGTICFVMLCHGLAVSAPASAEVFDTVTTTGDGWDVTFHPTNQNYAFFSHHQNSYLGCFYRIDPDAGGPLEQGDGCFAGGTSMLLAANGGVGGRSSVWVTSDGLTAYMPLNSYNNGAPSVMGKFDISDPDPDNWMALANINWPGMESTAGSIMVDDVIYSAQIGSGFMAFDTSTDTSSTVVFSGAGPLDAPHMYEAAGKIWAFDQEFHVNCFDPATGALCAHDGWVDGRSADSLRPSGDPKPDVQVQYRNTDGSFGGFCGAAWGGIYRCINAAGESDTTMVNPLEQHELAMGTAGWSYYNLYGRFTVSRQHQVIIHEPGPGPAQDYFCWDYTTQAVCANFITAAANSDPGVVYTIIQDAWNDNCFWSNSDNNLIGVWETSHTGGFSTSGGECDVTFVAGTANLVYDGRGGSGEPDDQTGDAASDVTVSATEPTREGYTFTGWNTEAGGTGTSYAGNDSYTLPNSGTDTLYAQWQSVTTTTTTVAPTTTTTAPPVVAPPTAGPADPVTGSPTFTG